MKHKHLKRIKTPDGEETVESTVGQSQDHLNAFGVVHSPTSTSPSDSTSNATTESQIATEPLAADTFDAYSQLEPEDPLLYEMERIQEWTLDKKLMASISAQQTSLYPFHPGKQNSKSFFGYSRHLLPNTSSSAASSWLRQPQSLDLNALPPRSSSTFAFELDAGENGSWQLSMSPDGNFVAILMDDCVEIRSDMDCLFSNIFVTFSLSGRDEHPHERKLTWSLDSKWVVVAHATRLLEFFSPQHAHLYHFIDLLASNHNLPLLPDSLKSRRMSACVDIFVMEATVDSTLRPVHEVWVFLRSGVGFVFHLPAVASKKAGATSSSSLLVSTNFSMQEKFVEIFNVCYSHPRRLFIISGVKADEFKEEMLEFSAASLISRVDFNAVTSASPSFSNPFSLIPPLSNLFTVLSSLLSTTLTLTPFFGVQSGDNLRLLVMQVSPDGHRVASLDRNRLISVYSMQRGLQRQLTLDIHDFSDRAPLTQANSLDSAPPMIQTMRWWSNSSLLVSFTSGHFCVINLSSRRKLAESSCDDILTSTCYKLSQNVHQRMAILECFVDYRYFNVRGDGVFIELHGASSKSAESSALSSRPRLVRPQPSTTHRHLTQNCDFYLAERTFRLKLLRQTTPDNLVRHLMQEHRHEDALRLATRFRMDKNLILQHQWQTLTSIDSTSLMQIFHKITDVRWKLQSCLEVFFSSNEEQLMMIDYGLSLLSNNQDSKERAVPCTSSDDLESTAALFPNGPNSISIDWSTQSILSSSNKSNPPDSLSTKEFQQFHSQFLNLKDQLATMREIVASTPHPHDFKSSFSHFCKSTFHSLAIGFAREGDMKALEIILRRHWSDTRLHYFSILENIPTCIDPAEYAHLLPSSSTSAVTKHSSSGPSQMPWNGVFNEEEISKWILARSVDIDTLSGQLDFSVKLLSLPQLSATVVSLTVPRLACVRLRAFVFDDVISRGFDDFAIIEEISMYSRPPIQQKDLKRHHELRDLTTFQQFLSLDTESQLLLFLSRSLMADGAPHPLLLLHDLLTHVLPVMAGEKMLSSWLTRTLKQLSANGVEMILVLLTFHISLSAPPTRLAEVPLLSTQKPKVRLTDFYSTDEMVALSLDCLYASPREVEHALLHLFVAKLKSTSPVLDGRILHRLNTFVTDVSAIELLASVDIPTTLQRLEEFHGGDVEVQRRWMLKLTRQFTAQFTEKSLKVDELMNLVASMHRMTASAVPWTDVQQMFLTSLLSCNSDTFFPFASLLMKRWTSGRVQEERGEMGGGGDSKVADSSPRTPPPWNFSLSHLSSEWSMPVDGQVVVGLVVDVAKEYVDNASDGNKYAGLVGLAFECLRLLTTSLQVAENRVVTRELDFIDALHQLHTHSTTTSSVILPIQLRIAPDRLNFIPAALKSSSALFKSSASLFDLSRKLLGVDGGLNGVQKIRLLEMAFHTALDRQAYPIALEHCLESLQIKIEGASDLHSPITANPNTKSVVGMCMTLVQNSHGLKVDEISLLLQNILSRAPVDDACFTKALSISQQLMESEHQPLQQSQPLSPPPSLTQRQVKSLGGNGEGDALLSQEFNVVRMLAHIPIDTLIQIWNTTLNQLVSILPDGCEREEGVAALTAAAFDFLSLDPATSWAFILSTRTHERILEFAAANKHVVISNQSVHVSLWMTKDAKKRGLELALLYLAAIHTSIDGSNEDERHAKASVLLQRLLRLPQEQISDFIAKLGESSTAANLPPDLFPLLTQLNRLEN